MKRTIRAWISAIAVAASFTALTPKTAAAEDVDLLLVMAADVSRSVDAAKFQLQRNGYAAAITNPRVLKAIQSGPNGRIAVAFVEWSGVTAQKLIIDWTKIGDMKSGQDFASQIVEAQRPFADRTSISGGIEFAYAQLERSPFKAPRRTIDISGDGTNNSGRDVTLARDEVVAKGVTINGLVILSDRPIPWNPDHTNPPGGLTNYYRNNVIGGPGAFVIEAENFEAFGQAIINKLIAEIADLRGRQHARLPFLALPR
ncbi:MAG TPA: DUF1194 domain-containing protein [Xanthobacteraceae bacterium]|nr:DUF1194 domain-containing protein [Xanthobacteraceae bacterium]